MDINRRTFLLAAGTAAIGAAALPQEERALGHLVKGSADKAEPFYGRTQPGISTGQQEHAQWTVLNLKTSDLSTVERLLRLWSTDAARLMNGQPALGDAEGELAAASNLTVTFGFAYSLFSKLGRAHKWPYSTTEIPGFAIDKLNPQFCDGDIVIQVCGNDRVRVHHTTRELIRDSRAFADVHWQLSGFLSGTELNTGQTPRNLFGQKDGTANFAPTSPEFKKAVYSGSIAGATSMVVRRIQMNLDKWEKLTPMHKEEVIGRKLHDGAPLTGGHEFSKPDYTARAGNRFVIPIDSHIRRAHETKSFIHRRGYNYQIDGAGIAESGLMFVSFQSDPATFVKIQKTLAIQDALNTWTTPVGSGLFFVPPGCAEGEWIGKGVM